MQQMRKSMIVSWRGLLTSLAIAVVAALSSITSPLDRMVEIGVGHLAWRPVSGDIVIVGVDDKTLQTITTENMTVPLHAQVISRVHELGAKRIFVDFTYEARIEDPAFDDLTAAVQKFGNRAVLAVPSQSYLKNEAIVSYWPSPKFGSEAQHACICWEYGFWQVWDIPLAVRTNSRIIPSFASLLADMPLQEPSRATIDYSYEPKTIPTFSALDVINGKLPNGVLTNKDVIFASMSTTSSDRHHFPGHDLIPGASIHVIAGETLKRGLPIELGWLPSFILAAAVIAGLIVKRRTGKFLITSLALALLVVTVKVVATYYLVNIAVGPSLLLLAISSFSVTRAKQKQSAQRHNPISGLPNFGAMRELPPFKEAAVVAAEIINFEELVTYLPQESGTHLIEQIARRLELATTNSRLHHDADGSFAWLVLPEQKADIDAQLSGLAALFNAPITIHDRRIDVKIAFGINDEPGESNAQRLAAARGAAGRAVRNRTLIERYARSHSEDATWKLSFHSQLEDAMASGDIWVAFQPQYHIKTGKLCGLEALARWTHPQRGMIPPDQFIVQAEQSQDIYRLTLFVMDRAIQSAAELRSLGHDLSISVNLSATLLDRSDLASTIHAMLLAHQVPPSKLTIEITETAQFEDSTHALETLAQLRHYGIPLSIDDYGTGQSNLEYLTRIEADEIKIDKRFVKTMRDSQRNFEIVKSTIELAHRLGAVAVAEGIEDEATLHLLEKLGCDVAQGYHLGKPQLFFEILASLQTPATSKSA